MANATFEILKGIQASVASLGDETVSRFGRLEARIDRLDLEMRKDGRDAAGMLLTMHATAGAFDAWVSDVEECVLALEQGRLKFIRCEMLSFASEIDRKGSSRQTGTIKLS